MGWALLALIFVGSICGAITEMRENSAVSEASDDEFNHNEGDEDYGE